MNSLNERITLNNGYKIPCVGFGTWQTPNGEACINAVKTALSAGYRHIDTAAVYGNEEGVGKAVAQSEIAREDIFITSKVWNVDRGYDKTMRAFENTLNTMKLDYLDMYLIHWPANAVQFDNWQELNSQTWRAMTELYKAGRIKAIGVSNFLAHHLEVLDTLGVAPAVNQIEFHPGFMQTDTYSYCIENGIAIEAWSPLGTGKMLNNPELVAPAVNQIEFHPGFMQTDTYSYCIENGIAIEAWSPLGTGKMLNNPELIEIAEKYSCTVAQLCIRWCMQNRTIPLPKSVTPNRIKENANVFGFEISAEDMQKINSMPYIGGSWCMQNRTIPLPKSVTPNRIKENANVFGFEISAEDMQKINSMPYIGGSGYDPDNVMF